MDRHALAAGDVTHDLFSPDRITASCAIHHDVINVFDFDSVLESERAFDHLLQGRLLAFSDLASTVGRKELGNDISRQQLAVAYAGEHIVGAGETIVGGHPVQLPGGNNFLGV